MSEQFEQLAIVFKPKRGIDFRPSLSSSRMRPVLLLSSWKSFVLETHCRKFMSAFSSHLNFIKCLTWFSFNFAFSYSSDFIFSAFSSRNCPLLSSLRRWPVLGFNSCLDVVHAGAHVSHQRPCQAVPIFRFSDSDTLRRKSSKSSLKLNFPPAKYCSLNSPT